jgi:hypothetical protein
MSEGAGLGWVGQHVHKLAPAGVHLVVHEHLICSAAQQLCSGSQF